jgi:hypothetical protein
MSEGTGRCQRIGVIKQTSWSSCPRLEREGVRAAVVAWCEDEPGRSHGPAFDLRQVCDACHSRAALRSVLESVLECQNVLIVQRGTGR